MMGDKNPSKRFEVRNKIRNTMINKYKSDATYRNRVSIGTKRAMSRTEVWKNYIDSRGRIKKTDTSIELKIENELKSRGIRYEKQKSLLNMTIVDFYLPFYNIVIYTDGDYWHNKSDAIEKDAKQNKVLTENGYKVVRYWEHEINKSSEECINRLVCSVS